MMNIGEIPQITTFHSTQTYQELPSVVARCTRYLANGERKMCYIDSSQMTKKWKMDAKSSVSKFDQHIVFVAFICDILLVKSLTTKPKHLLGVEPSPSSLVEIIQTIRGESLGHTDSERP